MIAPPIHNHMTNVPTCTPIVTGPPELPVVGADTKREIQVVPRVGVDGRRADAVGEVRVRRDRGPEHPEVGGTTPDV